MRYEHKRYSLVLPPGWIHEQRKGNVAFARELDGFGAVNISVLTASAHAIADPQEILSLVARQDIDGVGFSNGQDEVVGATAESLREEGVTGVPPC